MTGVQRLKTGFCYLEMPFPWDGFNLPIGTVLQGDSFLLSKKLYFYNSKEKSFCFTKVYFSSCAIAAVREKKLMQPSADKEFIKQKSFYIQRQ